MTFFDVLLDRAISFIPVLLSLTVHEWAHAWTAWRLGDDTAKMLGRVSLNPIDHIDPIGTLLLPLMGVPFGWAKPVPINPLRFRTTISMPVGLLLTAAAGPISNLLLAMASGAVIAVLTTLIHPESSNLFDNSTFEAVLQFLQTLVIVNILLACFNLLPIPPLDGSRIAEAIMPTTLRPLWNRFANAGPIILVIVILFPNVTGFSLLSWPLRWAHELVDAVTFD